MWFKKVFFALLKKYAKLFISMCLIGVIGVTFFISGLSSYINLKNEFSSYLSTYNYPELIISTTLADDSDFDAMRSIEGIESIDTRFSYPMEMTTKHGVATGILNTFNESQKESLYIVEEEDFGVFSVYVSETFVKNNSLDIGDVLVFNIRGTTLLVCIKGTVYSPETMYTSINGLPVDDIDYGYVYVSENELVNLLEEYGQSSLTTYRNQALINFKDGYDIETVTKNCLDSLPDDVNVVSHFAGDKLIVRSGINANIHAVGLNSIVIPSLFLLLSIAIVALFVSLIIRKETRLFGILMSIGVKKRRLILLFECLILFITFISVCLGIVGGILVTKVFTSVYLTSYCLPKLAGSISLSVTLIGCFAVILANILTCFLSCLPISKLTPAEVIYDKVDNNNTSTKVSKRHKKYRFGKVATLAGSSIKAHKFKFIISAISLFSSFVLLFVSLSLNDSAKYSVNEYAVNRCNYSCQVYVVDGDSSLLADKLKTCSGVEKIETVKLVQTFIQNGDKKCDVTIAGIDPQHEYLRLTKKGGKKYADIPNDGIVLESRTASELGVKIHDFVTVGNLSLEVTDLSELCFNKIQAVSLDTFENFEMYSIDTLLFNANDSKEVKKVIVNADVTAYPEFTENMAKYIHSSVSGYNIMIIFLLVFAFGLSILIVSTMNRFSFIEEKRKLSILRVLGYKTKDISKMNLIKGFAAVIISLPFACISGFLISKIFISSLCTPLTSYIFTNRPILYFLIAIYIVATNLVAHFLSMSVVRKFNLVRNVQSRE